MKDTDWYTIVGYGDLQISYTESDAKFSYITIDFEIMRRIYSMNNAHTYILAGFRSQMLDYDIKGFKGRQIYFIDDTTYDYIDIYGDVRALSYKVSYLSPMAGFYYDLGIGETSSLNLMAAYMLTFADDYDYHILRNKYSEAHGTGNGFYSKLNFQYSSIDANQSYKPFFSIYAEFFTTKISTGQTQEWYGDDPISEEDDTGNVIEDIPHEITTLQFHIGLSFGLAF
ncbi:MAG: hypothetical protein CVT49_08590 [candidate division Zixibacteria bacterium HGW-Zixibacteria-1]|nr:MAG: hypothetical protein CVT49_08590 [candidate division Zixibacteria bacterium HGW-Zixibacteria-1]